MHPGFDPSRARPGRETPRGLLRAQGANEPCQPQPVSAVIPARNEAANIARAVRSVAAQEGLGEIVVVDDQSEDQTGEVLQSLKAEIPNLRVLRIESLPEGWLGKPHALAVGARATEGEWLLFSDADTEHRPGSLLALLERAEREAIDLLSVSPGQKVSTWWEKAIIPLVFTRLESLYRFEEISDPRSSVAAANGQYLLIRRQVYEQVGGHESVRREILEDVELARRVKAAGGRLLFLPGAAWVETHMYQTFHEMWEGWTKNLFPLYARSPGRILTAAAETALLDVVLPTLFLGMCAALVLARGSRAVALVTLVFLFAAITRQWNYSSRLARLGFEPGLANYLPVGGALFGLLLLNSMRAHLWSGSVRWKGRNYLTRKTPRGKP